MLILLIKFLHIAAAIWFISGLLGRTITQWQASRSTDIKTVATLMHLSSYFENWMVRPGSIVVLGFGLLTAWAGRWSVLGALEGIPSNWLLVSTVLYLSAVPIIPLVFIPRGKVFASALEQSLSLGTVTADLRAAFADRVVRAAHGYELAVILVVTLLMVLKPF
jgi:uncharacterized membrane protein